MCKLGFVSRIFFIVFCLMAHISVLADDSFLSLGVGHSYGGAGVKYSHTLGEGHIYGGLGVLAYSSDTGAHSGYALGYEYPVISERQLWGVFWGKVAATLSETGSNDYVGGGITYSYYWGDVQGNSWILGGSLAYGKRDIPSWVQDPSQYDNDKFNALIMFGYQF
ncbi:hypothetical protein [Cellvibrio japonicus]|uniref:hypothetical protein n=1 Tax=Cellvibrio japonicus TaxID=155077 RepID=UPI00059EE39D|nr:hypothetical protein [Cellvibrio japonicus]QEI11431.1 hypothetical protein FY117_03760 [Cellvibrio japonicus]QEI15005.1 hypothetical protein FY116_03760 [Cellvibrio japonicus]QEI18585.1 hypothetical protein FY115_03760 [Cellvibrio japonicus]